MSDIVKALREGIGPEGPDITAAETLMDEAAEKIERLEAALREIAEQGTSISGWAENIARKALAEGK